MALSVESSRKRRSGRIHTVFGDRCPCMPVQINIGIKINRFPDKSNRRSLVCQNGKARQLFRCRNVIFRRVFISLIPACICGSIPGVCALLRKRHCRQQPDAQQGAQQNAEPSSQFHFLPSFLSVVCYFSDQTEKGALRPW